jgi:hypothetical protein
MAKAKAFNLKALDTIDACNKPHEIEIRDVNGMPTGFFVSVLGAHSTTYRNIIRGMADEALRKQATGKPQSESLEKLEARNLDALVAATVGWRIGDSSVVEFGDEQLEFTPANVRRVYAELLPVREQVAEAINDVANFMSA